MRPTTVVSSANAKEVGGVYWCAGVGEQSEQKGTQYTSLGVPRVQCDGAGCVTANPYGLWSSGQVVPINT